MLNEEQRELVVSNMGIVYKAAIDRGKYNDPDAIQWGFLGLCKAAERFDPTKGVKFSTYAYNYVKWSLNGPYSETKHSSRVSNGDVVHLEGVFRYDLIEAEESAKERLRDVMLSSDELDRKILKLMYFGYSRYQITRRTGISYRRLEKELIKVKEICSDEETRSNN